MKATLALPGFCFWRPCTKPTGISLYSYPKSIPMQSSNRPNCCMNCNAPITEDHLLISSVQYGYPLCDPCETQLRSRLKSSSREAAKLYFYLRRKGIRAELQKDNGYRKVDIAVAEARLDIEVDGKLDNCNPLRAMAEMKKSFCSFKKGYNTLHVPNALVAYELEKTVEYISDFVKIIGVNRY